MIPACTPRDHCGDGDDHNGHSIPVGIQLVHRVVEGIAVAVGADPALLHLEPVGLQEQPQLGVVVAGVEILEARVFVETLADPAFGFRQSLGGRKPGRLLAPGVGSRFSTRTPPTLSATRTDPSASVKT
jgi:hypothetical protein